MENKGLSLLITAESEYIKRCMEEYLEDAIRRGHALVPESVLNQPRPTKFVYKKVAEYKSTASCKCQWCGSKSPKEDRFHSGTCENCGGPL